MLKRLFYILFYIFIILLYYIFYIIVLYLYFIILAFRFEQCLWWILSDDIYLFTSIYTKICQNWPLLYIITRTKRIYINKIQYNNTESFWRMILKKLKLRSWIKEKIAQHSFFSRLLKEINKNKVKKQIHSINHLNPYWKIYIYIIEIFIIHCNEYRNKLMICELIIRKSKK